jgi:hypothetical protein
MESSSSSERLWQECNHVVCDSDTAVTSAIRVYSCSVRQ